MRKLRRLSLATLIMVASLTGHAWGQEVPGPTPPAPELGSTAGILFELGSGRVYWAKNDREVRAPASLTKILTALVVLEKGQLDSVATITPEARNVEGGRIFAEEGWTFTVRELLYGLLLNSGNDAAVALAQKVSPDGTVAGFVQMMNDRARALGAMDSNFVNPHGMDEPGHVTTARDLAIITTAAMKNDLFREIVALKTHDIPWGDGRPQTLINHNKLLWRYEGAIGIKTGFTNLAGHSLASGVTRDGATLTAILMGSPNALHYDESVAIYDWAFGNLQALRAAPLAMIRPVTKESATSTDSSEAGNLDIIQLEGDGTRAASKTNPTSAPLLAPLLALAAAAGIGVFARRRRRVHRPRHLMSEFRRELEALAPDPVPEPEQVP